MIIFGLIFFLVFLICYLIYLLLPLQKQEREIIPGVSPVPTYLPSPTLPVYKMPDKITINNITVNNFYKEAVKILPNGDVVIADNGKYQMVYFKKGEYFMISVVNSPFEVVREEAEREFLDILGVDKQSVCQLPVNISTPQFANPDFAGETYSLSFCL